MSLAIDVQSLTTEEKDKVLKLSEGHFGDLKSRRISPAKLSKTLSAFANTAGGELHIGIEEVTKGPHPVREWDGFSSPEEANGHLQAFEALFPLGEGFRYEFLSCEGVPGLVLRASVGKTRGVLPASDGVPYIRRGAQSLPVRDQDALDRLRLDKGIESFETRTVNADVGVVSDSLAVTAFIIEVVPATEPEPWLRKQQLLRSDKPTVGAVLLFADEPQAILPKRSAVKVFRYATKDPEGSRDSLKGDPVTIEGPLYDVIRDAVQKTVEVVEGISILGTNQLVQVRYPREALHEIITNAVLHRDYSHATDVQVRIFDNRIEVESPGKLPGHITEENILAEQLARNPVLVRLVNKFPNPPNKDVGEGLNTAFEAMRKLKLKEPLIAERESSVLVTIRHESLASPEEAIMEYLDSHEEINNSTVRELTGIGSENRVKDVFYRLRDQGLLERTPGKRGSASTWRRPA